MNKKILASIFVIGILAFAMGWGTYSYFSDTEKSTGNVFTAGTIDIDVDGANPWTETFTLADVKPCEVKYIRFIITNVGTNPVVIWKHLKVTATGQGVETEPEKEEETAHSERASWTIDKWITYDLKVDSNVIFAPEDDIKVSDVDCVWMPLGTLAVGGKIAVEQSYHLQPEVTNWAQGDTMTFDIVIYGEQKLGTGPSESPNTKLFLDNKDGEPNWYFLPDGTWAIMDYDPDGPAFGCNFRAKGLTPSTEYSLIYYADPWPGNHPGALITTFTTDGSGNIPWTYKAVDINLDLPDHADANYPKGAKIWLVPSTAYNPTTKSMSAWNPTQYLYESNLITYNDSEVS